MNIIKRYISFRTVNTSSSGIQSIVAGSNITVDNTDPLNPVVSATGGSGEDFLIYDTVDMSAVSNYTAVQGDNNRGKLLGKSTAQTFTLPQLLVGTQFVVRRTGAGVITFVAGSGVTITNTKGDLTDPGQGLLSFISYKSPTEVFLDNGTVSGGGSVTLASLGTTLQTAANDTPLDADTWNFYDAVDAILKKISWANIKATLKTYFDTLYAPTVSQLKATSVKTSAYSVQPGEYVPIDTTAGVVAITLPIAPADGTIIGLKWVIGTVNFPTYTCGGSDVLNKSGGSTSGSLQILNQQVTLIYKATGAIWYVETSISVSGLDGRYQPLDSDLTQIAGLTAANGDFIYREGGVWVNKTTAQVLALFSQPTYILVSDVSVNADVTPNTFSDATGYSFPVVAGTYEFVFWCKYSAAATTTGSAFNLTGPTFSNLSIYMSNNLTATTRTLFHAVTWDAPSAANAGSLTINNLNEMRGIVTVTASGTIKMRFCSEISGSAITIVAGGYVMYRKIA